jgi:predicted SAM-dependent methyltransferase
VRPNEPVEILEQYVPPFSAELLEDLGLNGLHCGCGKRLRPGWLNVDMWQIEEAESTSTSDRIARFGEDHYYLRHDLSEPFPVGDQSFDWIYSEHLIEHLGLKQAVTWLEEMRRLLKPGGGLRLTTPDLKRYVDGYLDPSGEFYAAHRSRLTGLPKMMKSNRRRAEEDVVEGELPERRAWMFNQIFRYWSHKWIYDFEEVRYVAVQAGFAPESVVECSFGEGRSAEACSLDNPVRIDESLYVEIIRDGPE